MAMTIDTEVISPFSKKESRAGRNYFPKWAIFSSGGIAVLVLVGLIKALLPVIGMAFLLAFIWSQAKNSQRY